MSRTPRAEQFGPNQVCVVHLIQQAAKVPGTCLDRAFDLAIFSF